MSVTYSDKEVISEIHSPAWESWWPGTDGCASQRCYDVEINNYAPTPNPLWYNPEEKVEFRGSSCNNGRRGKHIYPPFTYTPYVNSSIKTVHHLLKRRNCSAQGTIFYRAYGSVPRVNGACTPTRDRVETLGPMTVQWNEVTHSNVFTEYVVNEILTQDIEHAAAAVENEVSIRALAQYDVLTDLAEAREIPGLVRSIASDLYSILRGLHGRFGRDALRTAYSMPIYELLRHPSKVLRKLGDNWMEYRYGIMPLIYSYRDITKVMKRGQNVKSKRVAVVTPTGTGVTLPGSNTNYRWTTTEGYVQISGNVFQHFEWSSAARLAGLGINPLTTLWELIPYSFVVDWFVNVGDYITRKTTLPASQMQWACISQRKNYIKKTFVHYKQDDKTIPIVVRKCTPWYGSQPPAQPSETCSRPEESQLHTEVRTNSYSRQIFLLNGAQLTVSPSLNWRRLIDSAVMANNQLGAYLRHFR